MEVFDCLVGDCGEGVGGYDWDWVIDELCLFFVMLWRDDYVVCDLIGEFGFYFLVQQVQVGVDFGGCVGICDDFVILYEQYVGVDVDLGVYVGYDVCVYLVGGCLLFVEDFGCGEDE